MSAPKLDIFENNLFKTMFNITRKSLLYYITLLYKQEINIYITNKCIIQVLGCRNLGKLSFDYT